MVTQAKYDRQAVNWLNKFGLKLSWRVKDSTCPTWQKPCDHIHGDHYWVTLRREGTAQMISFDFWNSQADKHYGRTPSEYDILACISSDAHMPTDPDEVVTEFGEMKPSQAIKIAEFAQKLQRFLTEAERDELAEIQ